jgi:hypothetical protein
MLDDEMDAWLREEAGGCPERVILSYRRLVADVRQQKNEAIARLRDVEQKAAVDVERARADANRAIAAKHIARKLYNLERNLSRAWRGVAGELRMLLLYVERGDTHWAERSRKDLERRDAALKETVEQVAKLKARASE